MAPSLMSWRARSSLDIAAGSTQCPAADPIGARPRHGFGLGKVERDGLLAEHMLARAEAGDGVPGVQRNGEAT